MWTTVSPLARCTVVALTFMFVWALAEALESTPNYAAAVWQSRSFLRVTQSLFRRGDSASLLAAAKSRNRSHVAAVFAGGRAEFHTMRNCLSLEQSLQVGTLAVRIAANRVHQRLRQNLSVLATIAAPAPFIRFVGTVIGILDSFAASVWAARRCWPELLTASPKLWYVPRWEYWWQPQLRGVSIG
jgi:biopolymer transport protein TolQ